MDQVVKVGSKMTTQITPAAKTLQAALPRTEDPQLDEGLWRAWIEKNEKRDKVKFARRVKVIGILAALLALSALIRQVAG